MRNFGRTRLGLIALAATSLSACTGGINAGEEGGVAFIAFTVMLIVTCAVLYYFLGREE